MNSKQSLQDVRVLVVDDDPDILEVMEIAFSSEGAVISTAVTGDDAVTRYAADQPELVVLDMMLPRRSGFLVLERIQQDDSPPPVIMVTANEGRRHKVYAESLGVSAYLNKPVPMDLLVETALEVLGNVRG
ncbi:MAG: response regulator [Phycisphaerales bacterium]|jgi:DNA-binding response OmpR family regulator|nr:response regulator [Phycisphaerales bacterium]